MLPTPTLLSSHMRPPSSSTRRLERVRPRPVPSSRELPRPPCWNDSKIRCWSASGTPMPLSVTVMSTSAPRRRARTTTEPPAPVNLTALVIRLSTICLSRSTSECTTSMSSATSRERSTPWVAARSRSIAAASSRRDRRSIDEYSRAIFPASIFERSRISLRSSSRWRPELWMSWRYSSWRSLSSPNIRSRSTSENPSTALSGVLSSWDMLARNSDLCRLASSSSRLCSLSSR